MATIISIDWTDSTNTVSAANPSPASVEKNSCVIFVNNLDVDITIDGESGLFPGLQDGLPVTANGGINATRVSEGVASGKSYLYDDGTASSQEVPRTGYIDIT